MIASGEDGATPKGGMQYIPAVIPLTYFLTVVLKQWAMVGTEP